MLEEATDTKGTLSAEGLQRPDMADRAQVESDASIQLRTRDRERKLISKNRCCIKKNRFKNIWILRRDRRTNRFRTFES